MFACQPQPVFPILYMPSINCVSYSLWSSVAIACVTLFIPVCLFLNIPWPLYHCLRFTCVPVYPSLRLNFYPSLCLFVNPSLCYPGYPSLPYLHACPSLCVLACVPVFSSLSSCVSYNVFLCVLQCVPVHPTYLAFTSVSKNAFPGGMLVFWGTNFMVLYPSLCFPTVHLSIPAGPRGGSPVSQTWTSCHFRSSYYSLCSSEFWSWLFLVFLFQIFWLYYNRPWLSSYPALVLIYPSFCSHLS